MLTRQKRESPQDLRKAYLALASGRLHFLRGSQAISDASLLHRRLCDPEIEAFFHLEPMMAAIGVMTTFCTLWYLAVFILYQITRIAFQFTI